MKIRTLTQVLTLSVILLIAFNKGYSQQTNTYRAKKAIAVPVIDGLASDTAWTTVKWASMNVKWIENSALTAGDYSGKYKVVWSGTQIYVLAEIIDNTLDAPPADSLVDYWEYDCIEIFVDENNNGGNHQYSHDAFAYHISTKGDVIDLSTAKEAKAFNNNVTSKWTKNGTTYTWEFAVKNYNSSFVDTKTDNSAALVPLNVGKSMGFSVAYNDSDGGHKRQGMYGSNVVTPDEKKTDLWINADYFGELILEDLPPIPEPEPEPDTIITGYDIDPIAINVYPNPSNGTINFDNVADIKNISLFNLTGELVKEWNKGQEADFQIRTDAIEPGLYVVALKNKKSTAVRRKVIIQ